MRYNSTTPFDVFFERAKAKHGSRFQYDPSKYRKMTAHMEIECTEHGPITVKPVDHLASQFGCKLCGQQQANQTKSKTQEDFLRAAAAVHGNRYLYENAVYHRDKKKVLVTCTEHGDFPVTPSNHIRGKQGCPKCVFEVYDTNSFIKKAMSIHGNKFNYSETSYIKATEKVTIECPKHGFFKIRPDHHFRYTGCPGCRKDALRGPRKKRPTLEEFIGRFREVHGDRYKYHLIDNVDATSVPIICVIHGRFDRNSQSHLGGLGCSKCVVSEKYFTRAKAKHGDRFDYSSTVFVNPIVPFNVRCRKHGVLFSVGPQSHLSEHGGCPKCSRRGVGKKGISREESDSERINHWMAVFKEKHGNRYEYSPFEWEGQYTALTVICKRHGPFNVSARSHGRGVGCPACKEEQKENEFFDRLFKAQSTHQHLTFDRSKYRPNETRMEAECDEHGAFTLSVQSLMMGGNCPDCSKTAFSKKRRKGRDYFIAKAMAVHAEKNYIYTRIPDDVTANDYVDIECTEHGVFNQRLSSHTDGVGCPWCTFAVQDLPSFLKKAREVHGYRYIYDKTTYANGRTKSIVTCPEHGDFSVVPHEHCRGSGCPGCNTSHPETMWLNELGIEVRQYKIKLPRRSKHSRKTYFKVDGYDPKTNTVYEFHGDFWHGNPKVYDLDKQHPKREKGFTFGDAYRETMLKESMLRGLGYDVVSMWEDDWQRENPRGAAKPKV